MAEKTGFESDIDAVMADAFDKVRALIDAEALRLFAAEPRRYSRFSYMVGWGPSLSGPDGKSIDEDDMTPRARAFMKQVDRAYDIIGADNHQILSDGTILEGYEPADLPPIAFWVQSISGRVKELVPVYVLGVTDRADEGMVGVDLRVRPVRMGEGEYEMVVNPDDVETIAGEPFELASAASLGPR
jgi:hypothetical protein